MKPDEILEKTLSGELQGDALTEAVTALTVEEQAELSKKSKESAATSLGEASALRKERDRANTQKTEAEKEALEAANVAKGLNPDGTEKAPAGGEGGEGGEGGNTPEPDATMTKFRKEQVDKAVAKFKTQFKDMSEEQHTAVLEHFEKIDSGLVDSDNIYNEIVGAYAFVNKDSLLEAGAEKTTREAEAAAEAAADAGGSGGEPNNGNQPPKFSEPVKKLAKDAGISEEAAQKVATEGTTRVRE